MAATPSLTLPVPVPRPNYSQVRENLVNLFPPDIICLLGCRGPKCRYEGPAGWTKNQQVIKGLFSNWVTKDIIAMARPSTRLIDQYDIIRQFKKLNIKSIINMQIPGEHAHCGPPLEPESGFTYSPQTFMENDIFFFNFCMPDFGTSGLSGMLDGVKVLAFAVKEGTVAVHCHAGLGRTGVLIACYLVYTLRISPSEAVHYVRIKRPRSIQTRAQISLVFDFARLLGTQLTQYPDLRLRHGAHFTLQHHLNRQSLLLHGQEGRDLRHTPKVVYLLCLLLSCLALGLPAPPEVQEELQRRTAVRALAQAVRESLLSKQFMPMLRRGSWSWNEPRAFQDRKREVLRNKRSYSDSDLTKITFQGDFELGSYYTALTGNKKEERIKPDKRAPSPVAATPTPVQSNREEDSQKHKPPIGVVRNGFKSKSCKTPPRSKYSSHVELPRSPPHKSGPQALVARTVAKVMSEQDPPAEAVLQRAALLQEELNTSDCGWALLVTESDPHVLTALLWAWLEKLKDPVLSAENIEKLTAADHLNVLQKPQRDTTSCLLNCVGQVTSLCPLREDAVLRRLIRALTRRPQEELESHAALMRVFKSIIRENVQKNSLS